MSNMPNNMESRSLLYPIIYDLNFSYKIWQTSNEGFFKYNSKSDICSVDMFIDTLRIISGLLLFNAISSYVFTGTSTWGYKGKWTDTEYLYHRLRGSPLRKYTIESLEASLHSTRYLLSINKQVFDVTAGGDTYNPHKKLKSKYSTFVGRDCTRMFINGCFHDMEQCTWDLRNIGFDNEWVEKTVDHWVRFYENHPRYWKVGYLEADSPNEEPKQCLSGVRYPGQ